MENGCVVKRKKKYLPFQLTKVFNYTNELAFVSGVLPSKTMVEDEFKTHALVYISFTFIMVEAKSNRHYNDLYSFQEKYPFFQTELSLHH